ncbi:undecaprenyl/decaprenyl-phosphate alpha-N-acetylglucosaminyl 1-phosphate transferase [Clostridium sp. 'deep sea']|uniref:glycosyltransferase family 4 protein n=1 Tax=Clostridium sp. 'deep sea' TaxID=2779445 RepID=UPI001896758A|nr:MraY family glycosyltransferase [Clostridium sp. 'deep sea']QOR34270.1 undecaprenyl/decaprenyl-phosphate alpha-N-acetylglucosaminyl 1-phosphate transferase [Clostridium sp. 'deep sea']
MANSNVFFAGLVSFIMVLVLTPFVKKFAFRVGAVDHPNSRRINKVPIPSLGGLGIIISFFIGVLLFGELNKEIIWILTGTSIIALMGLLDDIKDLSPWLKLIIQFGTAALVVIMGGVRINFIRLPFSSIYIGFGVFAIPITMFWITGVTNALNFIDGLDGLAAGTAGIASTTLLIVAMQQNTLAIAVLLAALVGSCLGFLKYNFNPAQIFMGDTGALPLGFILATVSVHGLMKSATTIAIAVPVLALGLPLFDTSIAVVRRLLNGKSPFHADRGHLHHKLLDRGLSQKQAVGILYSMSLFCGCLALVLYSGFNTLSLVAFVSILGLILIRGNKYLNFSKNEVERDNNQEINS